MQENKSSNYDKLSEETQGGCKALRFPAFFIIFYKFSCSGLKWAGPAAGSATRKHQSVRGYRKSDLL